MALNPKFKITTKSNGLGKIDDITKEFKITKSVKKVGSDGSRQGGKNTSSGKVWKDRK